MRRLCWMAVLVWALVGSGVAAETAVAHAQSDASILTNRATLNYPNNIVFELTLADDVTIDSAVLTYDVEQARCLDAATDVPVAVNGRTLSWTWEMVRSGNPPPGAMLWWQWTLTGSDGAVYTTPRQTLTFADTRFNWRTVSSDNITLHWYEGEVGPLLLDAAVAGLDQLQNEMGIDVTAPVQLYIYGDADDMRQAVLYIQDWAGGVAFSEYNIILLGVPPQIAQSWGVPTVRHELTHLVLGQFGRSCVGGRRPTWLEEGLAVYAEGEPQENVVEDIATATAHNSFEPLRSLAGSFSSHSTEAGIAYSQSYSVVDFMLREYGQDKMQALILTLAQGVETDAALTQVLGVNTDGLEQAWRASLGLPPRVIPPTPTPLSAASVPTLEPIGRPVSVPTPETAASAAPPPAQTDTGFCGLALLPLLAFAVWGKRRI